MFRRRFLFPVFPIFRLIPGLILLILGGLVLAPAGVEAANYVVDDTGDTEDGSCLPAGAGSCTLREAFGAVVPGDAIAFTTAGPILLTGTDDGPVFSLALDTGGVTVNGYCTGVDGTGQLICNESAAPTPRVTIDCSAVQSNTCLYIATWDAGLGDYVPTSDVILRGLAFTNCPAGYPSYCLNMNDVHNSVISANYFGLAADGTQSNNVGETSFCLALNGPASDVTIGGIDDDDRNVIVGCDADGLGAGIILWPQTEGESQTGILIQGNYIGVGPDGETVIPNDSGISVGGEDGSTVTDATIGGDDAGAGNLIVGNTDEGIVITGSGVTGSFILGNMIRDNTGRCGINLVNGASDTSIGVDEEGEFAPNTIEDNSSYGLCLDGEGQGNRFRSNTIDDNGEGPVSFDGGAAATLIEPPDITTATSTSIAGTFEPTSGAEYFIDLYNARTGVMMATTTVDGSGTFSIGADDLVSLLKVQGANPFNNGASIHATVTDSNNNTSGFSDPATVGLADEEDEDVAGATGSHVAGGGGAFGCSLSGGPLKRTAPRAPQPGHSDWRSQFLVATP